MRASILARMIWVRSSVTNKVIMPSFPHVSNFDPDLKTARALLGKDAIIGVTVANVQEALTASKDGADYLGIGTMFATPT